MATAEFTRESTRSVGVEQPREIGLARSRGNIVVVEALYCSGGRNEEAAMPLLFWYPIIILSGIYVCAIENAHRRSQFKRH